MPSTIEQLHRSLSGAGLSVLAVNIQDASATVSAWAQENRITMPILLDSDGAVTRQYGVIATPTTFLIDREGRQVGRAVGPRDWNSPAGKALVAGWLRPLSAR